MNELSKDQKDIIFNALDMYAHGTVSWDEDTFHEILQLMGVFAPEENENDTK